MAWTIVGEPEDAHSGGYDGAIWLWRLEEADDARSTLVKITGSAIRVAEENLPERTAAARASRGRSEIERVLDWYEPPSAIELGTWADAPRFEGGSPQDPEETALVEEIKRWFEERGIDLFFDRQGDEWIAPLIRRDQPLGAAEYGVGNTQREAAEDARSKFEAFRGPSVFEKTGFLGAGATLKGSAEVVSGVGAIPSGEEFGVPEVKAEGLESVPEVIWRGLEEIAAEFGWSIGFTPEPDGSFFWFVCARETGELLQHGRADSWEDAKIESILNLYPPSEEGKSSS
jgi:hypothetical protein